MKNDRMFLRCTMCGNLVGMVEDGGVTPVCCGKEMKALKPNTTDAAQEKHVPVAKREGDTLTVTVGSVPHPMTEEHHIAWIVVASGNLTQRIALSPTGAPEASFCVKGTEPVTIYEYCNLHGLWAAEI